MPRAYTQDELKAEVGRAAIAYVRPGTIVGVGTGSTVAYFIEALGAMPEPVAGAVSSSERSTAALRALGITVHSANEVERLDVYVDGADEVDPGGHMIKGGGAALTREKIVASLADRFICIADASKLVDVLGAFPLPVEVIPMACSHVMRELRRLGGEPRVREGFVTGRASPVYRGRGSQVWDIRISDEQGRLVCISRLTMAVLSRGQKTEDRGQRTEKRHRNVL